MLAPSIFLALSAMTGLSSAYSIDPNSINATEKSSWCLSQTETCPQICNGVTSENNCDPTSLNWTCTCASGTTPNVANYEQTIHIFECQQYVSNCVAANTSSASNQQECLAIQCGDMIAGTSTTSSSSSSSTSSSTTSSSQAASTSSTPASTTAAAGSSSSVSQTAAATHKGAAAAIGMARDYGTPALAAGVLAAFGLAI